MRDYWKNAAQGRLYTYERPRLSGFGIGAFHRHVRTAERVCLASSSRFVGSLPNVLSANESQKDTII